MTLRLDTCLNLGCINDRQIIYAPGVAIIKHVLTFITNLMSHMPSMWGFDDYHVITYNFKTLEFQTTLIFTLWLYIVLNTISVLCLT